MDRKRKGLMYPSVKFLRASSNLETFSDVRKSDILQNENGPNGNLSGAEAREFYENLLTEPNETHLEDIKRQNEAESSLKKHSKTKKLCLKMPTKTESKKHFSDTSTRQVNSFLKMAQDGNADGLQKIIRDNKVDVNATDQFGWTALMCAAKNGHKACVKLLIRSGANIKLQNNRGETCKDIADKSGIQGLFETRRKSRRRQQLDIGSEFSTSVEETCDVCRTNFFGSKQKHDTSTAHLFNCQYKSERTFYHIPENNIGFQLMKQKGWNQEKGLGPEGTGRKFPVKTILKQDRQGLGSKNKAKPKITHFSARDTSAIEGKKDGRLGRGPRVPRRTWKRKLVQKQEKDKKWEHDLRVYMNTD